MTKFLFLKQISNDKDFPLVERFIQIFMLVPNSLDESFEIKYRLQYIKDGEDISGKFSQEMPAWIVSNNTRMMERSIPSFEPIENPDYDPGAEEPQDEYLMKPSFDYIIYLVFELGIPLTNLLELYISEEDRDGRFD